MLGIYLGSPVKYDTFVFCLHKLPIGRIAVLKKSETAQRAFRIDGPSPSLEIHASAENEPCAEEFAPNKAKTPRLQSGIKIALSVRKHHSC